MMDLDEAIKHCEDKVKELRKEKRIMALTGREREWADCLQCAEEHEQLAEWLKDYKRLLAERGRTQTMTQRLIDANALYQEFSDRALKARQWKEGAILNGNEEAAIRADAVLAFLVEVKAAIEDAPTVNDKAYAIGYAAGSREGYKKGIEDARPIGNPVIKCKDCKYQIKEWREDRRMKEKGYWSYGCKYFGELMGYWGFGGNDNEFCSEAEQRDEQEAEHAKSDM